MNAFDYTNRKNTYGELDYEYPNSNRRRNTGYYYYDANGKLHVDGIEGLRAYKREVLGMY